MIRDISGEAGSLLECAACLQGRDRTEEKAMGKWCEEIQESGNHGGRVNCDWDIKPWQVLRSTRMGKN